MFYIDTDGQRLKLVGTNWKDKRIYLKLYYPTKKVEEIGYISLQDECEDDLDFRTMPTEVISFIEDNWDAIIEGAEY